VPGGRIAPVEVYIMRLEEASRLLAAGRTDEARARCQRAILAAPSDPRAYHLLATILVLPAFA